jgi:hypothetical protein
MRSRGLFGRRARLGSANKTGCKNVAITGTLGGVPPPQRLAGNSCFPFRPRNRRRNPVVVIVLETQDRFEDQPSLRFGRAGENEDDDEDDSMTTVFGQPPTSL